MDTDFRLLTADEAYQILGYSTPRALLEAAREGVVPRVRLGRRVRFDLTRLREWAAQGGTPLMTATMEGAASARAEAK